MQEIIDYINMILDSMDEEILEKDKFKMQLKII